MGFEQLPGTTGDSAPSQDVRFRGSALQGAVEVVVDTSGRIVDVLLDGPAVGHLDTIDLREAVLSAHDEARRAVRGGAYEETDGPGQ